MRLRLIKPVLFLFFYIFSTSGWADPASTHSAQQLINNMSQALSMLNYDGVFIYRRGQQMDTMRLIHKYGPDGEYERLVSLTGVPREVIRNNESVTCIFPDDKSVRVEKSRPKKLVSPLPDSIESVASNYTFLVAGEDRVTGRQAWVINIIPKDQYRYGYQLWIDKENSMLLRSELRSKSGVPLEQIMFTQLEIKESIPDELLKPELSGANYTWYENSSGTVSKRPDESHWKVTWMPAGFSMKDYERHDGDSSDSSVEHWIYTDGIAMVSVFIERQQSASSASVGALRVGGISAYARHADGHQVTAVGEVPQTTVQGMANSVVVNR